MKLIEDTTSYLINATDAFRLEEVIRSLDHLLKITDPTSEYIQQFYQTATALRSYDIAFHPDYLVFEYWNRILIRKEQSRTLSN